MGSAGLPLTGCRVVVTRERPGELGAMLVERGAEVVHVPLISVEEPADGGTSLRRELAALDQYDWLVVTSAPGAELVAAAAGHCPDLKLAAVGTTTARVLAAGAGRVVDVVPSTHRADALAAELVRVASTSPCHFLVAQAETTSGDLPGVLRAADHLVTECVAYRTVSVVPDKNAVGAATALVFASGSAVRGWVDAFGIDAPPVVVAIGPATASVAAELGLKLSGVAADHNLEGLVSELERQVNRSTIQADKS